jgi:hypothetical protein
MSSNAIEAPEAVEVLEGRLKKASKSGAVQVIGSTYRLPFNDMLCIDMPRIDMPRLGYTCRFHTFLGQVT